MKTKTITIAFASLFLLASCTGNNKKVNENTLWEEKNKTVAQTTETPETTPTPLETTVAETQPEKSETVVPQTKNKPQPETAKTELQPSDDDDDRIYERPDNKAYLNMSNREIGAFFTNNIKIPETLKGVKLQNTQTPIYLTVEKDGAISDVEIAHSMHPDLDKEYIRVCKMFPKAVPAKIKGKPVRSKIELYAISKQNEN